MVCSRAWHWHACVLAAKLIAGQSIKTYHACDDACTNWIFIEVAWLWWSHAKLTTCFYFSLFRYQPWDNGIRYMSSPAIRQLCLLLVLDVVFLFEVFFSFSNEFLIWLHIVERRRQTELCGIRNYNAVCIKALCWFLLLADLRHSGKLSRSMDGNTKLRSNGCKWNLLLLFFSPGFVAHLLFCFACFYLFF